MAQNPAFRFLTMGVAFVVLACFSVLIIAFMQVSADGMSAVIGDDEENPNFFQKILVNDIFQLLSGGALFILMIVLILTASGVFTEL